LVGLLTMTAAVAVSLTTDMLPYGLLPMMSRDLQVSTGQLGLLVTGYALMVALFAVPIGFLTARLPRRALLCTAIIAYALSNVILALSESYPVVAAARILGGLTHATFWAMLPGYVARLVPPERVGRAVTIVFTGITIAVVGGVPAGTALGVALGWRTAFAVLATLAAVLAVLAWRLLPDRPGRPAHGRQGLGDVLRIPGLRVIIVVTAVTMLGHFTFFTYIAPFLLGAGYAEHDMGPVLFAIGLAGAVAPFVAGLVIDRRLRLGLVLSIALMATAFVVMAVASDDQAIVLGGSMLVRLTMSMVTPFLQAAVLRVASGAEDLASAVNQSAFSFGIVGGGLIGAIIVDNAGLYLLPAVAAGLVALGMVATVLGPSLTRQPERVGAGDHPA
jgi:multidrug resistance protein